MNAFVNVCSVLGLSCAVFLLTRRTGKDGYVQIDGGEALRGQSKGRSLMVNTKGSLYLGERLQSDQIKYKAEDITGDILNK